MSQEGRGPVAGIVLGLNFGPKTCAISHLNLRQKPRPFLVGRRNVTRFSWRCRSTGVPRGCICDSLKLRPRVSAAVFHATRNLQLLELRFWLSRSRSFWRGRRLLWLELADVTMGDMQDAKCDLSTLNLSRGR